MLHAGIEESTTAMMESNSKKVTSLLKDKSISKKKQDEELIKIVNPLFDFKLMGTLCLGKPAYNALNNDQKNRFHTVFNKKIKDSYIGKLHLYTDEKLEFETAKMVKKDRMTLQSYLITKTEKKPVVYKFYESEDKKWLIYDVDIFGVSIVQTYRNQFAAALKTKDFDQFLAQLNMDIPEK
jgi:phospholipid transport system substrate-binding protein